MELVTPGFEVHVAEWLEPTYLQLGEFHEYASISSKSLKVKVTLPIKVRAHFLDLEIGHITNFSAEGALV
jgi:hypothetical protein